MRTITVMLALGLVGCGGEAFTAAGAEAIRVEAGTDEAAPDAGRDDEGGGNPAIDGGSEAESNTEAGHDAAPDVDAQAEGEAGPAGDAGDGGLTPVEGCVAYFAARAKDCACVAVYHGCDQQVTDAGDCPAVLGTCQASCDYDGGGGSAALCYCIFSCLAATSGGACLVPNQGYMTCDVSDCNASNCP